MGGTNTCLQTHAGFGFASENDVERKFRETCMYQVAPISTNLILSYVAEHVRRSRGPTSANPHEATSITLLGFEALNNSL